MPLLRSAALLFGAISLLSAMAAQSLELYLYENEIGIGTAPHLEQITHDKVGKSYVTFSPAKDPLAYVADCSNLGTPTCPPKLAFRDLKGNELYSFLSLVRRR